MVISQLIAFFSCSHPLASDCAVSEWSEWSECNKSCGKGHMIRTRMIMLEPQFGGDACPETVQRKKCKIRKCSHGSANSDERKRRKEARKKRKNKQGREDGADELAGDHHHHYRHCGEVGNRYIIFQRRMSESLI